MQPNPHQIVRRNGHVVPFSPEKIENAIAKAFLAVYKTHTDKTRDLTIRCARMVAGKLYAEQPVSGTFQIERVQDEVETALMLTGEHDVAKAYILYREERTKARTSAGQEGTRIRVSHPDGSLQPLDVSELITRVERACRNLPGADSNLIVQRTIKELYDGVKLAEVGKASTLAARNLIEKEPAYSYATARLLLDAIYTETFGSDLAPTDAAVNKAYSDGFITYLKKAADAEMVDPSLLTFDIPFLSAVLQPQRDLQFGFLGLQTLYDRYFIHIAGRRIEAPQHFYMRVAMGLAVNEDNKNERAAEFYDILSSFDFMSSTPTLFNSGTMHPQLSSCYLTTIGDALEDIYGGITENALLSKYAGGLGNDWTPVRAMGSHIKGTNGKSQGVIPFLNVVNATAVAVNQGGKRKGAVCAYLETWHMDIEEFLELRKNTGDDRRRTHDMDSANWIPDLFMKRVMEKGEWTLFSPNTVPDLHDLYGKAFEEAYTKYERLADEGNIKLFKRMPAADLWRKMLTMLFETGHPWFTFKDPCNIRSPQQHMGVVHSSNLCTEITLNTSADEIAVCNLGSVNLPAHIKADGSINHDKLKRTITTAMRMLDNVIDINYYPVEKARTSNMRHRPVGMGVMGLQDALHLVKVPFASDAGVDFSDEIMEAVAYYAYSASSDLAAERGKYSTYEGSLWSKGILPQDTVAMLEAERGRPILTHPTERLDWTPVRAKIAKNGMRNSNCIAIAPTATISNIIGVSPCIEPDFKNLYVKSNLSGEFTVINEHLVRELKERGLWDDVMVEDLKYFDGDLSKITRVPADIALQFTTSFQIEPIWYILAAARRGCWIDQAQSLNIFMAGASGKLLDSTYKLVWEHGVKTTYYLRTLQAQSAEKSTGRGGELNAVSSGAKAA
jgi:ribonucleoside-diphosphate reductase alpha chain